jgi:hypothetical protein
MSSSKNAKIVSTYKTPKDSATFSTSSFEHEPLDYRRGAIRLLRVLPHLSSTGLVQCEIWHDNVNATYDCLSYVWGSDKIQQQVLLNGRLCRVRQNLWDFLRVARTKYASTPPRIFWIDALCIDQDSLYEKTHQVAQMGSIYSNAVEVISWLGFSDSIIRAFTFGIKAGPSPSFSNKYSRYDPWEEWLAMNAQTNNQLRRDWLAVVHNTYWTRAWITQEIFLARKIKLLVNDMEVEPRQISRIGLEYVNDFKEEGLSRDTKELQELDTPTSVFLTYLNSMCGDRWHGDRQLINLFDRLPGRQSYLIHDQVYSLLSIATDAASIPVDYRCSKDDLLRQLLKIYGKSLCICSWFYMLDMLDCSLIPGFKTAVLMIPMKLVQTEFVMGEKQKDWYDTCSSCHARMSFFDERETLSFCIKSLCEGVRGGHLYLQQARNGRYNIKRNDGTPAVEVLRVELAKSGHEDDIDLGSGGTYATVNVYLAVDVVMRLFEYPKADGIREVPLRICPRASKGHRRMEFGEEFP